MTPKCLNTQKKDANNFTLIVLALNFLRNTGFSNILLFVGILSLTTSCASSDYTREKGPGEGTHHRDVHPDLAYYVVEFERHWGQSISFKVTYGDLPNEAVGRCTVWDNGKKLVRIDQGYWNSVNSSVKEQLMFHELGHCALGREHNDDYISFSGLAGLWPKSVMKSSTFSEKEAEVYEDELTHYVNELFN